MRRDRVLESWQPSEPAVAAPALGWVPVLALLLALVPRAVALWGADFPLNDGGMFAVMVEELVDNRFVPPETTSYNSAAVPWVYPPLPFYLAAAAVAVGAGDVPSVLLWLPLVLNFASVVAFCWAAEALVRTRAALAIASVAFAILPFSFNWQIMGGGLTRAAGLLFAILALGAGCRLFERRRRRDAIMTAAFAAAAILSHPEMPVLCGSFLACLWLVRGRSWAALRVGLGVAAGTLALTSPWWLMVLMRHGIEPLTAAAGTVQWTPGELMPLPLLSFTGDGYATPLAVLAAVGAAFEVAQRRFVVPLWLLAAFAIPRLGFRAAVIPAAILVGVALGELIWPAVEHASGEVRRLSRTAALALSMVLLGHALVMVTLGEAEHRRLNPFLTRSERDAMRWVKENVTTDARFLVVGSASSWAEDPASEWFPALARRLSVATPQGREWLPNDDYLLTAHAYDALVRCRAQDLPCLAAWQQRWRLDPGFVFVSKIRRGPDEPSRLAAGLAVSSRFTRVYDGPGATIFARR